MEETPDETTSKDFEIVPEKWKYYIQGETKELRTHRSYKGLLFG